MKWYHVIVIATWALVFMIPDAPESAPSPYAECRKTQALDIELQEKRLVDGLKDPSSYSVVRRSGTKYSHSITYTATNSYGGRVQDTVRLPLTRCETGR